MVQLKNPYLKKKSSFNNNNTLISGYEISRYVFGLNNKKYKR